LLRKFKDKIDDDDDEDEDDDEDVQGIKENSLRFLWIEFES